MLSNPLLHRVHNSVHMAKISILIKKGSSKNSYERCVYESVDDSSRHLSKTDKNKNSRNKGLTSLFINELVYISPFHNNCKFQAIVYIVQVHKFYNVSLLFY